MKESITLVRKEAETIMQDLQDWAEILEMGTECDPWCETMFEHARLIRDKLAGRID